jgi:hypothetical protein
MDVCKLWNSIPLTTREPLKSFAVSIFFGSITAIGVLGSAYFTDHPYSDIRSYEGFAAYLISPHAIGAIAAAIGGVWRARQGLKKAQAFAGEPSGTTNLSPGAPTTN